jgi:hypothetical protein
MTSLLERIKLDRNNYCNYIYKEFSKKCFDKRLNVDCGNLLMILKNCNNKDKLTYNIYRKKRFQYK